MALDNGAGHLYKVKLMRKIKIRKCMRRLIRKVPSLLLCVYSLFISVGCADQTRYELLTFFFTGVLNTGDELLVDIDGDQLTSVIEKQVNTKVVYSSHVFYTQKRCNECHVAFFARKFGESQTLLDLGSTDKELNDNDPQHQQHIKACESCHDKLSTTYATKHNLWRHAPISKGNCTVCHFPHQSTHSALLKDSSEKLCIMCHSQGLITLTNSHKQLKDCMVCHNPHLGKDKYLLVSDYKESTPVAKPYLASRNP